MIGSTSDNACRFEVVLASQKENESCNDECKQELSCAGVKETAFELQFLSQDALLQPSFVVFFGVRQRHAVVHDSVHLAFLIVYSRCQNRETYCRDSDTGEMPLALD